MSESRISEDNNDDGTSRRKGGATLSYTACNAIVYERKIDV